MRSSENAFMFPEDDYTPHGYLDNPAHCRVLNMSGVIRSYPAIGMGWWYPTGRFDDGDNAGTEYVSLLQLAFRIGDTSLAVPDDFETQRMNSRPPVGIYKHHWDAMQVHEPRTVLAETAIDAMTLSYTDPELAKEELYGVFADAPGAQVPCTREDGSMNMIAADGSRRFLIEGDHPGNVSDYVRTVDVEASVAEAVSNLATYARILDLDDDAERWSELAPVRTERVREMFIDGWYRDIDIRTGKPIVLEDYYDIMMLAPVTCGVATDDQVRAIAPMMEYFVTHPKFWLDWPSFVFPFADAAWNAGRHELISDALYTIADRVYGRLDSREVVWLDRAAMHTRIPGVSYEFWPCDDRIPGGGSENYGWGATMPANIIRGIFGFRESCDPGESGFNIAPTIPKALLRTGSHYGVSKLRYRGVEMDLDCLVGEGDHLDVTVAFRAETEVRLTADVEGSEPVVAAGRMGALKLSLRNGSRVQVLLA